MNNEQQMELNLEWPESEERIDIIGSNGSTGAHYAHTEPHMTHYLDIKKQMLSQPTDMEVLTWLTTGTKSMSMYKSGEDYYFTARDDTDNLEIYSRSSESFLDAIKKAMVND